MGVVLCALFLFSSLRSLIPWVDYAINYEYIAGELCVNKDHPELQCNGKCHLTKELAEVNQSSSENEQQFPQIDAEELIHHVLPIKEISVIPEVRVRIAILFRVTPNFEGRNPHPALPPPKEYLDIAAAS